MAATGSFRYAKVLIDAALQSDVVVATEPKLFDYSIPVELEPLQMGHLVSVPFGRHRRDGFIISVSETSEWESTAVRPIHRVTYPKPLFGPEEWSLANWLAKRYLSTPVQALKMMLPPAASSSDRLFSPPHRRLVAAVSFGDVDPNFSCRAPKQYQALKTALSIAEPMTRQELAARAEVSPSTLDSLVGKGYLKWIAAEGIDEQFAVLGPKTDPPELTSEQAVAMQAIEESLSTPQAETFLLRGVTGSGKTELYIRAIQRVLADGGGAILLVPEISLTPQMIRMVGERLGTDELVVLHSSLTARQRNRGWKRLYDGDARVVLGARSAVFAPCKNVSLIIIDEEHETSYKQDQVPRYHAREVALKRAQQQGATVVMGSATPSVESYYWGEQNHYRRLYLPLRVNQRPLPRIQLIDMREERKQGNRSIFSRRLFAAVRERLDANEQVVLFLNHRGYSAFLICADCGLTLRCPDCNVTYTYHWKNTLRCHYCDRKMRPPDRCPSCDGVELYRRGLGTQKVEAAVYRAFPGARVARMDTDSVRGRLSRESIYASFSRGEIDVLVGTQMIAKGWDVPGVTLVGVIDADTALHFPDFRSAERTFQMVTQVAGRAGRGPIKGEVLAQTRHPEHPALSYAAEDDLPTFYQQELKEREALGYPPFRHLIRIIIRGDPEPLVRVWADDLMHRLRLLGDDIAFLGPAPAPLTRLRGQFRWHLYMKTPVLAKTLEGINEALSTVSVGAQDPQIAIDVDPTQML